MTPNHETNLLGEVEFCGEKFLMVLYIFVEQ